jgi:hypothetical protein
MPELCLTSCPSVLDVTNERVYEVLTEFLSEMADIFPDPVLMLGGDEVGLSCHDPVTGKALLSGAFDLDPAAAARMQKLGINSSTATDYFWGKVTQQVMTSPKLKNKTLQVWYYLRVIKIPTGIPDLTEISVFENCRCSIMTRSRYCPSCHTGDPPLERMPRDTVADVWGSIDYAATACKAGYRSVLSMSRGANATLGEAGTGWYLPPYGGGEGGGLWPGTWPRDLDSELERRGCDEASRNRLIMGGEQRSPLN